jgi:hypothetical protein
LRATSGGRLDTDPVAELVQGAVHGGIQAIQLQGGAKRGDLEKRDTLIDNGSAENGY